VLIVRSRHRSRATIAVLFMPNANAARPAVAPHLFLSRRVPLIYLKRWAFSSGMPTVSSACFFALNVIVLPLFDGFLHPRREQFEVQQINWLDRRNGHPSIY